MSDLLDMHEGTRIRNITDMNTKAVNSMYALIV